MSEAPDLRRRSPSVARNREPLADALADVLPASGDLVELAAGTGEHAVYLAARFPELRWQPTDVDPEALESIAAWRASDGTPNLASPVRLDVTEHPWPVGPVDAVLCVNLIHISPWACTEALMVGAAAALRPDGALVTYGAYRVAGEPFAPSNVAFDAWLKERDPRFGVRDLDAVVHAADSAGLALTERRVMPANNLLLVFRRALR